MEEGFPQSFWEFRVNSSYKSFIKINNIFFNFYSFSVREIANNEGIVGVKLTHIRFEKIVIDKFNV